MALVMCSKFEKRCVGNRSAANFQSCVPGLGLVCHFVYSTKYLFSLLHIDIVESVNNGTA